LGHAASCLRCRTRLHSGWAPDAYPLFLPATSQCGAMGQQKPALDQSPARVASALCQPGLPALGWHGLQRALYLYADPAAESACVELCMGRQHHHSTTIRTLASAWCAAAAATSPRPLLVSVVPVLPHACRALAGLGCSAASSPSTWPWEYSSSKTTARWGINLSWEINICSHLLSFLQGEGPFCAACWQALWPALLPGGPQTAPLPRCQHASKRA
jgi:hypothetical protein